MSTSFNLIAYEFQIKEMPETISILLTHSYKDGNCDFGQQWMNAGCIIKCYLRVITEAIVVL